MRWIQIVEGVTFLLLSVWWIVTAVILDAAWQNSIQMDTASRTNNSSITVADNILADTHENKLHTSLGYQLFGISVSNVTQTKEPLIYTHLHSIYNVRIFIISITTLCNNLECQRFIFC